MKRFLVHGKFIVGERIQLPPEEARHAYKVLRLGVDDEVLLTDGLGKEAHGKIVESAKEGTFVSILSVIVKAHKRKCTVELMQAPLKGPKMDWLVEKLTELGLDMLYPVKTEHTVADPSTDKEERWTRLVQSALKQSGNSKSLKIAPLTELTEALAHENHQNGLKFLLSPSAPLSLAQQIQEKMPT